MKVPMHDKHDNTHCTQPLSGVPAGEAMDTIVRLGQAHEHLPGHTYDPELPAHVGGRFSSSGGARPAPRPTCLVCYDH